MASGRGVRRLGPPRARPGRFSGTLATFMPLVCGARRSLHHCESRSFQVRNVLNFIFCFEFYILSLS
jgi:hypothetical protein